MNVNVPDFTELCNTLLRMEKNIQSLQDKLDKIMTSPKHTNNTIPTHIPTHSISNWIQKCPIDHEKMNYIFTHTYLEGFKYYVGYCLNYSTECHTNHECSIIPFAVVDEKPKKLYGYSMVVDDYDSDNSSDELVDGRPTYKWQPMTERHINLFIEDIWRRMLEYYYMTPAPEGEDETVRDKNKHKLLGMRKKLVEKHHKEIERFLMRTVK